MKTLRLLVLTSLMLMGCSIMKAGGKDSKVVIAYVTSWSKIMPNPEYMTHINYAFGHVNETFNGVRIDNENRLRDIVALKQVKPELKVLLSIGGWGSGRFSEMAADDNNREAFAKDCRRVLDEFQLDGIDIDWEYPTSSAAKISSSPDDTKNFTLMMKAIRKAIGKKKLLTLATVANANYIDFKKINSYIDLVNVMAYDMASAPKHHSALYRSDNSGRITSHESVNAHLVAGVPLSKLVLGMPFYGRGGNKYPNFKNYHEANANDFTLQWDDVAKVPYYADKDGELVFGYENPASLAIKCQYILDNDLRGGMYWDYAGDNMQSDLRRTVYESLIVNRKGEEAPRQVLVLTERGGQHGGFTDAALLWLSEKAKTMNFKITEINNTKPITETYLSQFHLIIQLDFPPYTWTDEAQKAFINYIDEGWGRWIGFHHATLLGEFDGYPMWSWFSNFMGGVRFNNYVAKRADGMVISEDPLHPVMKGLKGTFMIPDDEWYTYDKSPRLQPGIHVLAHVDEYSYTPSSDIKMGDHPVIWTNENKKARNIYFQIGHSKRLLETESFKVMFENAIQWMLDK